MILSGPFHVIPLNFGALEPMFLKSYWHQLFQYHTDNSGQQEETNNLLTDKSFYIFGTTDIRVQRLMTSI